MRAWLLVAMVALAGCAAPDEEAPAQSRWTPCPQWITSGETATVDQNVTGNLSVELELGQAFQEHPLDLLELEFQVTGALEVRLENDGRRVALKILGPDPDTRPVLHLRDDDATAQAFLTAVSQGTPPAEGPVFLDVRGDGHIMAKATAWYRVCGIPSS